MNKTALLAAVLCALLTGMPARALNQQSEVETLVCQGPALIVFADQTFEKTAVNEALCAAQYNPQISAGQTIPWLNQATLQTQWITQPQKDVLHTLQAFIPQGGALKGYNHQNPDDLISAYQSVEREEESDTLNYLILRGIRQSDNSIRVYQFRFTLTAGQKPAGGYDELHKGPYEQAYDTFDKLVKTYRNQWFEQIQTLKIED